MTAWTHGELTTTKHEVFRADSPLRQSSFLDDNDLRFCDGILGKAHSYAWSASQQLGDDAPDIQSHIN